MRSYIRLFYFFSFQALMLVACTNMCSTAHKNQSPEQVVETYLNIGMNMTKVEQKEALMSYTTGALKAALKQASDESIREAYIDRKMVLRSYTVLERRDRTPRETEITFRLVFQDKNRPSYDAEAKDAYITAENTVSIIRENSLWLIRDVMGTKTTIDFGTSNEAVIKAKPGPGIDETTP